MLIQVMRAEQEVQIVLQTSLGTMPTIAFSFPTASQMTAELLRNHVAKILWDAIKADRKEQYEKGYEAGKRDARSRRPPTKLNWWSGQL